MKRSGFQLLRSFVKEELGQSAVVVAITITSMMALAATSVEVGHIYYAYQRLVASTNAAALAGGQAMPDITQAQTYVTHFSSESGQYNASSMLTVNSLSTSFYCSSAASALNVTCQTPPSGEGTCTVGTTCNALTVTQTASVNLWFGGLVGMRSMSMTAKASAAMRGGTDTPFNIAVIIDTTESMASTTAPASDDCGGTSQIVCAVYGLNQFLLKMDPCPLNTSCNGSGAYVDNVALFVFPAVAGVPTSNGMAGDASDDTTCPTKNPPTVPYNFLNVTPGVTGGLFIEPTGSDAGSYMVQYFDDSYRANDSQDTPVSSSDPLGVAAGGGGGSCKGLQAPGGQGTYYAQAIYQAQSVLYAASGGSNPNGSVNILIILSDGDANACASSANTAAGGCSTKAEIVADNCPTAGGAGCNLTATKTAPLSLPLNGTGNATTNPMQTVNGVQVGYESPTYPSALGECGQAVQAAQYASSLGTTVFTVAMGAETSASCTTDESYTIDSGSTWGTAAYSGGQACSAIEAMSTNPNKAYKGNQTFYSDATKGCTAPGTSSYTTIGGIFQAIADNLTAPRLIPAGS